MDTATRKHPASASLIAVSVLALLTGCTSAGAEAAPAVTPTPTRAACPNPHGGTCLGPLPSGEYHTTTFAPAITYAVNCNEYVAIHAGSPLFAYALP